MVNEGVIDAALARGEGFGAEGWAVDGDGIGGADAVGGKGRLAADLGAKVVVGSVGVMPAVDSIGSRCWVVEEEVTEIAHGLDGGGLETSTCFDRGAPGDDDDQRTTNPASDRERGRELAIARSIPAAAAVEWTQRRPPSPPLAGARR